MRINAHLRKACLRHSTRRFTPCGDSAAPTKRAGEPKKKYIDPEYRIKIRSGLVRGWEADDTENYIYVYSTKDKSLLRAIKREMEAMRAEYERQFPPSEPIDAVSTVRICKDEDEYRAYGGSSGSAGYWNWADEELVFYDAEDTKGEGRGSGTADTKIVLYHEAFHQYIYYSVGRLAPHTWFNEGYGDYFSGAKMSGTKVVKIGANPWRTESIQYYIEQGHTAPLSKLTTMEKAEYYARAKVYYPQGWSFVYFLRESPKVRKHPQWSKILTTYFETLKAESVARAEEMPEDPYSKDRAEIERELREAALEAAFADVDMYELEEAWKAFTLDVKPPR